MSNIANGSLSGSQKGSNLRLKCARICLVVRLCPDPLGELKRSTRPPSYNEGPTSKGGGEGRVERERRGIREGGRERKGRGLGSRREGGK